MVARIWLIWFSLLVFLVGPVPMAWGADVVRATLKNGLRVVIVRNTLAPVVTTQVNYLVGSNEAPAGFPGTAHALEHMMFRGSPGLSAAQLSTIAAAMGGDFNADTQQAVTQYFFTVPAEDLDIALRIEAIRMRGILATQKIWTLERGAIEQEVAQDLSNPQYVFYSKLLEAMYAGTPYAHDALGTRESFDRTTGAMLRNFHRTWYAPNNAILVIVGDVEPDVTLATVKRLFEGIPRRPLPPRPAVHLPPLAPRPSPSRRICLTGWPSWRTASLATTARTSPQGRSWRMSWTAGGGISTRWFRKGRRCLPASTAARCPRPLWATPRPRFPTGETALP